MRSSSEPTFPSGDSPDRSSTGIQGPFQVPVDDDEREIDESIVDLEDGFSFFRRTPPQMDDSTAPHQVGADDSSFAPMVETSLGRDWLVEHGER